MYSRRLAGYVRQIREWGGNIVLPWRPTSREGRILARTKFAPATRSECSVPPVLSGRVWSVRSSQLTFLFDDGEEVAARPEFVARRIGAADRFKGCDLLAILARIGRAIFAALRFVAHGSKYRNSAFVSPHRHLPVHRHRQEPVAELGEFLVLEDVVFDLHVDGRGNLLKCICCVFVWENHLLVLQELKMTRVAVIDKSMDRSW